MCPRSQKRRMSRGGNPLLPRAAVLLSSFNAFQRPVVSIVIVSTFLLSILRAPVYGVPITGITTRINQNENQLELGKTVSRELAGGQAHSYRITLAAGEYLRVVVEQRGIDV